MAPSLCGTFVTDKRSLIAFTWTITCISTIFAFIICTIFILHIHTSYIHIEHNYYDEWYNNYIQNQQQQNYNNNGENGDNEQQQQQQQHSADKEWEEFTFTLSSMRSGSLTFVSIYIIIIATTIIFYGSTAIVGFTSLRGVYIAPCFSSIDTSIVTLKLGIFGGAIIFFANLLLICAVIFGEVRVEDWRNQRNDEHEQQQQQQQAERELPYEIERIATVLAVTCMFLAALYSIFAILLFLYFGSKDYIVNDEVIVDEIQMNNITTTMPGVVVSSNHHHHHHHLHHLHPSSITGGSRLSMINDPRREKFITMNDTNELS